MATTATLISVQEYLHTSYHPDCDYVDGELEERNVGGYPHGKLQGICIEILSPGDRVSRATKVLADYAAIGVAKSWLIDPLRREAFVYDGKVLWPVEEDRLELPGSPIYLVLSDLFAVLDK